ncbi:metallophosphoesterase [Algoriphagus namhaensis]
MGWISAAALTCLVPLTSKSQQTDSSKIAFVADIHLQDVYGDFQSSDFEGVYNPKSGQWATIRTMDSQLKSTRLFNENYFALLSTLEDLREKGVRLVALPGDFTDDGQPMNVLALKSILKNYTERYGMRFFITTGNHDPVSPFGSPDGKVDFMGPKGENQAVFSERTTTENNGMALSPVLKNWGYFQIFQALEDFGFGPNEEDLFWTHPFVDLDYENYEFSEAKRNSAMQNRMYQDPESGFLLPDASYLLEPVPGIWLLALDANVFSYTGEPSAMDSLAWRGSSVGFNLAAQSKSHQLTWIKSISKEANQRGKTLISFSHYPLVDFHEHSSDQMKELFGPSKFQLTRIPTRETSQRYAEAGIRVHLAGHMHLNDTGQLPVSDSVQLINIQVPSLAAFPPAYKTIQIKNQRTMHIQTHLLRKVDRFDEFFDLYRMEHQWLSQQDHPKPWNLSILEVEDYLDYTRLHLQELIRLRFLDSDWPKDLGLLTKGISTEQLEEWLSARPKDRDLLLHQIKKKVLAENQEGPLMEDFYLIKNGGDLGTDQLPKKRLELYQSLTRKNLPKCKDPLAQQFSSFLEILGSLSRGLPSDDFFIDLQSLSISKSN